METPKICGLMMVKNEETVILKTLQSLKNLNEIIIYDTGSTDKTLELIRDFQTETQVTIIIGEGAFIDFATSRNEMHDFADKHTDCDYYLLVDANDELRDGEDNIYHALLEDKCSKDCYLLKQVWECGTTLNTYYNIRLVRTKKGYRYRGKIHEYLVADCDKGIFKTFELYQNRNQDCDSSRKRWERDVQILEQEHKENPTDTRTTYYLAQTYDCLGNKEKALEFYTLRSMMGGFLEEVFNATLKAGDNSATWNDKLSSYLKAYNLMKRAEPLVKIGEHYRLQKMFNVAYMFAKMACSLEYPSDCVLFVDNDIYTYRRWHLLGIVSYYSGDFAEGKEACLNAIKVKHLEIDINNLKFYIQREVEIAKQNSINTSDEEQTEQA
jgi:glycosyltransferase involved in cell wall biosynthesis